MGSNSSNVRIRRYRPDDIDAVFEAVSESKPELSQWMPWCHEGYCRADAESWVASREAAWHGLDEWSFIIANEQDRLLGACGIHRIDPLHGVGEVGYWVRTSATRRGVATAALKLLVGWAFEVQSLRRLEILVAERNEGSWRVAEKFGARCEGVLRSRFVIHAERHDCRIYAILQDD